MSTVANKEVGTAIQENVEQSPNSKEKITDSAQDYKTRYYKSIFQNDPSSLQEDFAAAVGRGENAPATKSDAYFITHRYIDNGGNIYEIFDFVDRHPELSFMKEAESIYPEVFRAIQERRAPSSYSDQGMYAYLAYLEVLERYGYANAAMLSTAANQYIKLAYYKKGIRQEKSAGRLPNYPEYTETEMVSDAEKGERFFRKAESIVSPIVKQGDVVADEETLDVVYATEQFGSSLRYFFAYGIRLESEVTAAEVFAFATHYTYQHARDYYLFLSLSNASTALLLPSTTALELRNAMYPFLSIKDKRMKQSGIVDRVIRARIPQPSVLFRDLDAYSQKNVTELGRRVPEFKAWLLENGWKETDF